MARDGVLVEVAAGDAGDPLHLPEVGVNLPAELVESFLHLDVENIRGELLHLIRLLLILVDDEMGNHRETGRALAAGGRFALPDVVISNRQMTSDPRAAFLQLVVRDLAWLGVEMPSLSWLA